MSTKQTPLLSNRATQTAAGTPRNVVNDGGRIHTKNGTVELATGELATGDIVMLCGIPTGAVVLDIDLAADDLDTNATETLAADIGVWKDAAGAVVGDVDVYTDGSALFESAVSFGDANFAFVTRVIEKAGQQVYKDAGDTVDPDSEYFIGILWVVGAATAAAGTLSFQITYAVD